MLGLFRKKVLNVDTLLRRIGHNKIHVSNGYSIGWTGSGVVDKEAFDNKWLKIGIGRTISGRGDWGGGFEYSSTFPIRVTIDKDYNIKAVKFDDFYNSRDSEKTQRKCENYWNKNNFKKLDVSDMDGLKEFIDSAFEKFAGVKDTLTGGDKSYNM